MKTLKIKCSIRFYRATKGNIHDVKAMAWALSFRQGHYRKTRRHNFFEKSIKEKVPPSQVELEKNSKDD